jgi:DNA/RNA-binding domain of Phe-tRNA-synthetase-like protein
VFTVSPSIAPEIYRIAPGFRALSIYVKAAPVLNPDTGETALREASEAVLAGEPEWAESHLAAWAEVFNSLAPNPNAPLVQPMHYVSAYYVTVRCQHSIPSLIFITP